MNYEQYPATQRFAVLLEHDGTDAPAGWPSQANPMPDGVTLVEVNRKRRQDSADAVQLGYKPYPDYVERTGKQLNELRAGLDHLWPEVLKAREERELESAKMDALERAAAARTIPSEEEIRSATTREELRTVMEGVR